MPASRIRGSDTAILVDCDGVLLNWYEGFRNFAEAALGRTLCPKGPQEFDVTKWLGVEHVREAVDLVRRFNSGEAGYFAKLAPMEGAVEAIAALRSQGREIYVITSCSTEPAIVAMRRQNLIDVFGDIFTEIHCLDMTDTKDALLSEYRAATWVEDKFENAVAGAAAGHRTYLIRASYNVGFEDTNVVRGVTWVNGWSDIVEFERRIAA